MDFFDLLPFIIAIVIFVWTFLFGKKTDTPTPEQVPQNENKETFQDILKRIEAQMQQAQTSNTITTTEPKTVVKKKKTSQLNSTKKIKFKDKFFEGENEDIKTEYKSLDVVVEQGLKDEERQKDPHLNPYKIANRAMNSYQKIFQDKEAVKRAFIMNELFQRKF